MLYAVLKDRWVTCRRASKMDVLFVGLSFLNLGCFLVTLLYLVKRYIPEWLHDIFEWGKTKHELKQSSWTQYLHVPNRWEETFDEWSEVKVTYIVYVTVQQLNIASSFKDVATSLLLIRG